MFSVSGLLLGIDEIVVSWTPWVIWPISSSLLQSQTGNPWSEMVAAPEEDWERLSKALSERDAQIAERDAQIAERDAQIAEQDAQIVERDAQIVEKDSQIAERDSQIAYLSGTVLAIQNSTSWKITAPARSVARNIRRLLL